MDDPHLPCKAPSILPLAMLYIRTDPSSAAVMTVLESEYMAQLVIPVNKIQE